MSAIFHVVRAAKLALLLGFLSTAYSAIAKRDREHGLLNHGTTRSREHTAVMTQPYVFIYVRTLEAHDVTVLVNLGMLPIRGVV